MMKNILSFLLSLLYKGVNHYEHAVNCCKYLNEFIMELLFLELCSFTQYCAEGCLFCVDLCTLIYHLGLQCFSILFVSHTKRNMLNLCEKCTANNQISKLKLILLEFKVYFVLHTQLLFTSYFVMLNKQRGAVIKILL